MLKALHLRIAQALVIISLTLVSLTATIPVSHGQAPEWSQPVALSDGVPSGWFPDVVVDATGQVHVFWTSGYSKNTGNNNPLAVKGYDLVMYATSQNGETWSKAIDVAALPILGGPEATRPAGLIDRQDMLHLTFRSNDVYYLRVPAASVSFPRARPAPHRISTTGKAYFSRMVLDKENRLHLILSQMVYDPTNPACETCFRLFYRRSDDNGLTWSSPVDISTLPTGSAKPQLAVDGQDNIHIVWEAGPGGDRGYLQDPVKVMYTASYDGGTTWVPPVEFVAPGGRAKNIALGIDGGDNLVVAWLGYPEHLVYYQISRDHGRSWSPPQPIAGVWGAGSVAYESLHDDYAMATDSAGNVHLVLTGRVEEKQKTTSVLHLTWDGSSWSEPEVITTLVGDVPEWTRIAIGLGNQLHVVWHVRDEAHLWDTDHGQYRIWYAHGQSQAPAIAPVIWPTPTATPTANAMFATTPTSAPSPTPSPTLDPGLSRAIIAPDAVGSLYTESDDLMLLAESLIPAALLVAVVMVGVHLRRR
jgi:hypothetical protein